MEQQKPLDLVKRKSTYKLIIPADVERKIRHLCHKVPNVEWSGTLFFTYEGSMEDDSLVITCKDIYVMDIGSAGYTEFDMSPEVISYMCDNPDLLGMQMGLIHSHNNMATFFSGTDTATLKEEGRDRNHFVSLIVNNEGTYTAAITRKVKSTKTIQESYSYGSFEDATVTGADSYQEEVEFIEYFGLDITKEGDNFSFQELDNRLAEIRKRKSVILPAPNKIVTGVTYPRPKDENNRTTPSLFTKDELERGTENEPLRSIKPTEEELPFTPQNISEADLQHVLLQLITGSIILRDTSKIDVKKWAATMPQVFGDRFGRSKEGLKNFEQWADGHCEFLIYDKEPGGLDSDGEADWIASFAMALYEELDALPKNEYIEILKGITEQWMIQ